MYDKISVVCVETIFKRIFSFFSDKKGLYDKNIYGVKCRLLSIRSVLKCFHKPYCVFGSFGGISDFFADYLSLTVLKRQGTG